MNKPLDTHDVRQSAYRGAERQPEEKSGIPDGKERQDPSASDTSLPEDSPADGSDRSGATQPNLGQVGSYGADNLETDQSSRNRTSQDKA